MKTTWTNSKPASAGGGDMSDTPRNDKLTGQAVGCSDALHLVLVDELSRNLERELAEARKHLRDANRGAEVTSKVNQLLVEELAEARRQVAVLVSMSMFAPCAHCDAKDFCDNQPAATPCEETIAEWSAQQAKEGGGK
jgi:hypothetical protein